MIIANNKGTLYLVVIDYYSRWLEIMKIKQKNTATIISKLINFGSSEFLKFVKEWDFVVKTSISYYPKSNGLAKKGICIAKN